MKFVVLCLALAVGGSLALNDAETQAFKDYGKVTVTDDGTYYIFKSDGYPDHPIGGRRTPEKQNYNYKIPINPAKATEGSCVPMGVAGIALNGVAIFNAFSSELAPALDCERTDDCQGHPEPRQLRYHYHGNPVCLNEGQSGLVGVAFDGFPIYREYKSNGQLPTTAEAGLDECHGKTVGDSYRYIVTSDYPWVLGCYTGTLTINLGRRCYKTSELQMNGCEGGTVIGGSGGTQEGQAPSGGQVPSDGQAPSGGQEPSGGEQSGRPGGRPRPGGRRPGGRRPGGRRPSLEQERMRRKLATLLRTLMKGRK